MKKRVISIVAILSLFIISCGGTQIDASEQGSQTHQVKAGEYSNVTVADLKSANEGSEEIIVLDVRTPGELKGGYVENAINMDINNGSFNARASKLDKSKTVYVYCRSGHRSQTASKALIKMGFTDVRNVKGGFLAWEKQGYKSVK
jgi:rhodanese-related sulfurtransferase